MKTIWDKVKQDLKEKAIPLNVLIELTRSCNLNCCHCYNFKDNAELSFSQIKKIALQLRQAGALFLSLTGGEIFTKQDIFDICFYLREMSFDLSVFTNGTLINQDNINKIQDLGLSEVGISIQGASADTHDRISGAKGCFEKSINAIKLLKGKKIPVNLKCTLMKDNFHEYKQILKLAADLGVSCIIDPIISPKDDGTKDVLSHRLDPEQLFSFYRNQLPQKLRLDEPEDDFVCPAGTVMASISANGDVYPCIQLPEKLGNVFESAFKDIWSNSEFLTKMRKNKKIKACENCRLIDYCTRCPGLAYLEDGDAFGRSSIACLNAEIYAKINQHPILSEGDE